MEGDESLMESTAIYIRKIFQQDNHTFAIEWNDGQVDNYRLSELQKNCPCAGCVDEVTGQRIASKAKISSEVRATRISNVGRYAIRIHFTSGCSHGIYSFDKLKTMRNP
jgi:DUF971 family protein